MSQVQNSEVFPVDVLRYIHRLFRRCNERVTNERSMAPIASELDLERAFMDVLCFVEAPLLLSSGWVVRIEPLNFPGGRHNSAGGVADVGILFILRARNQTRLCKVVLLRLSSLFTMEPSRDLPLCHGQFMRKFQLETTPDAISPRKYTFAPESQYKTVFMNDYKIKTMQEFGEKHSIPTFFLLLHPKSLTSLAALPVHIDDTSGAGIAGGAEDGQYSGCRVIEGSSMIAALGELGGYEHPTFRQVQAKQPEQIKLEDFIVNDLLCGQAGFSTANPDDAALSSIFAIFGPPPIRVGAMITIDAPDDFD